MIYIYIHTYMVRWRVVGTMNWLEWGHRHPCIQAYLHVKTNMLSWLNVGLFFGSLSSTAFIMPGWRFPFWRVGWSVVQCQALAFDMTDVFNPKRVYAWGLDSEEHDQLQATLEPWPFRCIHSKNRVSHSECICWRSDTFRILCNVCVCIYIYIM